MRADLAGFQVVEGQALGGVVGIAGAFELAGAKGDDTALAVPAGIAAILGHQRPPCAIGVHAIDIAATQVLDRLIATKQIRVPSGLPMRVDLQVLGIRAEVHLVGPIGVHDKELAQWVAMGLEDKLVGIGMHRLTKGGLLGGLSAGAVAGLVGGAPVAAPRRTTGPAASGSNTASGGSTRSTWCW